MSSAKPRAPSATARRRKWSWSARYGLAVAMVTIATLLQFALRLWGPSHLPYLLFVPAVLVVAILAGFWPGIGATLLATVAGGFFLFSQGKSLEVRTPEDLARPVLFLVIGVFLTALTCSRTEATEALEDREADLKGAQAVAHIGSWRVDIAKNAMTLSDETYRIVGLPPGEPVSIEQAISILHPEDRARVVRDWTATLETGSYEGEDRVLVQGNTRWVQVQANVERDRQGRAQAILGTIQDITERKRSAEALRSSEQRYRMLFEKTVAGVALVTVEGQVIDCNDAWARMFGYGSAAECRGGQVTDRYRDPAEREILLDELKRSGPFLNREQQLRRKDGTPFWVLLNSVLLTEGQDPPLIQSTVIDITARKDAEAALRASEEHFRILVEQASDGIFIADDQGKYLDANSSGAEMVGYTREEILKRFISDIVAAEEHPRIAEELTRLLGGETIRSEWKFRRADGSLFPGEVCAKRLPDGRLQGILRDMTERNRSEEIMRQSEERFRVALKNSPITVFSQDRDLRYTWIYNPHLYWQKEIIGKSDEEIIGAKQAQSLVALKRRVLETGVGLREEVVIPHNGTKYSFDITIEPILDSERGVIGITGASMDVARLRELADRLNATREKLAQEKLYLESEIETELGFEEIIGQRTSLREVLQKARVVAPTDSTVLLLGETGTGKELVARSVHTLSPRCGQSFIKLNCAAVPSGLLESELFGHEKGAFTGAVNQKVGRLELADKGTLFLDEVGELPQELQPKLLRVLQDREFERLGGVKTIQVDVRIISATNRDLQKDVAEKKFREDLFYRLNVFPLQLPPLRDRRSDIPVLVHHFVRKHAVRMGRQIELIPNDTMRVLQNWNWPGNIRELENMIERMVILSKGSTLASPPEELNLPQRLEEDNLTEMEREHIIRVLRETRGVLSGPEGAANRLGIKRTTLQSMLKRFDIEVEDFRRGTWTFGPD